MSFSNKAANSPFVELPNRKKHPEFYSETREPIALTEIQEKFESGAYDCITEFVRDFRNMLESYIKYFGTEDYIAKKAQKFDIMMEQKLALLSKWVSASENYIRSEFGHNHIQTENVFA